MPVQPPLAFSDAASAPKWSRAVRSGRARRVAHGLYTTDLSTDLPQLVREQFLAVTAHYCPGAIIADRSVPSGAPDEDGYLFVIHDRARPATLPGLTIVPRRGAPPKPDDLQMPHGLWLASRPRALLENLRPSRAVKGRPSRTLTRRELHDWAARLLRTEGAERLNRYRDRARELARELALDEEFRELDDLLGAVLGTREIITTSPQVLAAQVGRPFDETRDQIFAVLAQHLAARAPAPRPVLPADRARRALLPFFEAYFSNFIEGTEFIVDEAREIVFGGLVPSERPEDAHDVLETYRVVSDSQEMRRRPSTLDELLDLLRARHARMMGARPEKSPGELKKRPNRAGSTEFVAPHLVVGTLERAMYHLSSVEDPFARAVMMMFAVSEVHPFVDGNGRVARIMMNAELEGAREHRIVIPTVFRTEYLSSLRAMTHNRQPSALVRVLDFAQRFTLEMDFSSYDVARQMLDRCQAFVDPNEALARGIRLTLPSALPR
jgi:fido (protein-threonine AMPylation protein)